MNKLAICFIGLLTGISIYSSALAQDFYNGCRGPRGFQIDTYANYADGKISGMVIPKIFAKNLGKSLPDILLAVPNTIANGELENRGINLGYIAQKDNMSVIGALGMFKDNEEEYKILNPQIYFTGIFGHWTFDAEVNMPMNLKTHEIDRNTSATIGYAIDERLRFGGSLDNQLHYRGNLRVELTREHQYWLQLYFSKSDLGARLAINL